MVMEVFFKKMAKDPAFLFYSTDFYEGTRTMLPEERACYIDLLIYQHQNGIIPLELKRVLMYCSGVDEATLEATLEAKFKLTDKGWINERLSDTINKRKEYAEHQSKNGKIGQFWKKTKSVLSNKEYTDLRKALNDSDNEDILDYISDKDIVKATLEGLLKHLEIEIENENETVNKNKSESENKITFAENVKMKKAEFDKLKIDYGEKETLKFIETLNNYKGSSGKKYKSDYRAILSWVVDKHKYPIYGKFSRGLNADQRLSQNIDASRLKVVE